MYSAHKTKTFNGDECYVQGAPRHRRYVARTRLLRQASTLARKLQSNFDHGFDVRFSSLLGKRRITTRGLWATRCVSQCFDGSLESITSKTAPYNDASRYSADTTRGCRTYTFRNQRTAPFAGTVAATGLPQQQQYTGSLERYLLASGRRTINIYL